MLDQLLALGNNPLGDWDLVVVFGGEDHLTEVRPVTDLVDLALLVGEQRAQDMEIVVVEEIEVDADAKVLIKFQEGLPVLLPD